MQRFALGLVTIPVSLASLVAMADPPKPLPQSDAKAVVAAAAKVDPKNPAQKSPAQPVTASAAKVQLELRKKPDLDHVQAPKGSLADAQKAAFKEEHKESEKKK